MLPILTLNNLLQWDNTIFDDCTVPVGVDKDLLINQIVLDYGEMQVLRPDWSVFRYSAIQWFSAHITQLDHLFKDFEATYNPLYNKDATYEETRTPNLTRKVVDLPGGVTTESGETEGQMKGFNSSSFNGVTKELPGRVVTNSGRNEATSTETGNEKINRREFGNIGVTTSTQLLRDDSEFWRGFNFYQLAARLFAVDNLVMIY